MKLLLSFAFAILLLPIFSQGQAATSPLYNEANYVQQSQGLDPATSNELYAIWYKSTSDSTLTLKKSFLDIGYTQLLSKAFYVGNVLAGPYTEYRDGTLTFQAAYKQGKLDGEVLTYHTTKVVQRAFYTDGVKTGTWEEFDLEGKPTRKITYDQRGRIVSEETITSN